MNDLASDTNPHETAHPKKAAFLVAFRLLGTVLAAAKSAGISTRRHYEWLDEETDEGDRYRDAFDAAQRDFGDELVNVARQRAVEGRRKLQTYKGQPVFVWRNNDGVIVPKDDPEALHREPLYENEVSDTLLIALLNAYVPHKFKFNQPDGNSTITHEHVHTLSADAADKQRRAELLSLLDSLIVDAVEFKDAGEDRGDGNGQDADPARQRIAGPVCPPGQQPPLTNGEVSPTSGEVLIKR